MVFIFQSATTTRRLWQHLLAFIDNPPSHGEKKNALLGDNKHRQILFIKLVFLLESLSQIHGIQKHLESAEPMLHCMYRLKWDPSCMKTFSLGTETSTLLSMLSASEARTLKLTLIDFNIKMGSNL